MRPLRPHASHDRLAAFAHGVARVAVLVSVAATVPACGGEAPPKTALGYTADAKRAYEAAMVEFDDRNWIEAEQLLREVKRKYGYSKYARLAELRLADADFEQEKYVEAIRQFRQFVHDHRSDEEEVSYARSKIAEAQYDQIADSVLLPTSEERDQAVIMDAYRELRGYIHDYPDAKESKRMRALLADATSRLMRHELYVARFYLQKDKYDATVARIQYALRNFGDPLAMTEADSVEPEALLLLGETYLKMHRWGEARKTFQLIVDKYLVSGLTLPAHNYLEDMNRRGV